MDPKFRGVSSCQVFVFKYTDSINSDFFVYLKMILYVKKCQENSITEGSPRAKCSRLSQHLIVDLLITDSFTRGGSLFFHYFNPFRYLFNVLSYFKNAVSISRRYSRMQKSLRASIYSGESCTLHSGVIDCGEKKQQFI